MALKTCEIKADTETRDVSSSCFKHTWNKGSQQVVGEYGEIELKKPALHLLYQEWEGWSQRERMLRGRDDETIVLRWCLEHNKFITSLNRSSSHNLAQPQAHSLRLMSKTSNSFGLPSTSPHVGRLMSTWSSLNLSEFAHPCSRLSVWISRHSCELKFFKWHYQY